LICDDADFCRNIIDFSGDEDAFLFCEDTFLMGEDAFLLCEDTFLVDEDAFSGDFAGNIGKFDKLR